MATLVIVQGPGAGKPFPLGNDCSVIGRSADADIRLPSQVVSRHHAKIWCENGTYFIQDLGSSNGTLVNGKRIAGSQVLEDGDRLTMCNFGLAFQTDVPSPDDTPRIQERVEARAS